MTFFSGTDQNTLIKEGNETNHFVSLIVNNAGSYTAAVTRKVVSEKDIKAHFTYIESSYYTTYNNEKIVLEDEVAKEHDREEKTKDECIEYFDLEIIKEASDNDFEDLDNRLNSIKKSKSKSYSGYLETQYKKSEPTKPDYDKIYGNYHRYNDYSPSYRQYPYEEYPDYFEYHPTATKAQYDKSNQKSLFDDEDNLYLFDEFDDKIAENLSWQLITGSVLANMEKIDKKKILKNLDSIYEKRFGPLDPDTYRDKGIDTKKNNDALELWLDSIIGFLLTTEDEGLLRRLNMVRGHKKYTSNDTSELCAMAMFSYIDSLGVDSYAIQVILDCLLVYISEDARKYIKN